MSKAKMIKDMVKTKKESVMGKLGDSPFDDPMEPWSAKYNAPVKNEEVEQIDEALMSNIEVKPAKKGGDSDTVAKHDVHYKGKKIGHIEVYKHRSGMKYGDVHHATGEGTAGHRSMDAAIDSLRQTHAEHLKTHKDSAKQATKSLIKLSKMKEEVEQLEEDSWLFSYIKSLGYNPKLMGFAQRSKYARSNAFKHWKQSHMERRAGQTAAMEETEKLDEYEISRDQHGNYRDDEGNTWTDRTGGAHRSSFGRRHTIHTHVPDHPHSVHINGKKWKTFGSQSHATNVAKKIKGATVHREEVGNDICNVCGQTPCNCTHINEAGTGLLMTYIKAKGLNPLTMDGNQKHAYARSSEFKIFKQKHAKVKKEEFERLVKTYGAENLAELVMQIQETSGMGERGDDWNESFKGNPAKEGQVAAGGGTPADKGKLAAKYEKKKEEKKQVKEEADKADTVTMDIPLLIRVLEYAREDAKTDMDLHKVVENLIKMRDEGTLSMAQYDAIIKIAEGIENTTKRMTGTPPKGTYAWNRMYGKFTAKGELRKRPNPNKPPKELKELKKMPDNMDADDHITRESVQVQEGIGGIEDSPLSATNSVKAMESAHRSKQMKSARMIKALYKNKIKETTYDWEKDDKPNAKIVMKGGTTMTGQPRDTVEIEPVLKTRPNSAKPSN